MAVKPFKLIKSVQMNKHTIHNSVQHLDSSNQHRQQGFRQVSERTVGKTFQCFHVAYLQAIKAKMAELRPLIPVLEEYKADARLVQQFKEEVENLTSSLNLLQQGDGSLRLRRPALPRG